MTQSNTNPTDCNLQDEIDLFDLLESLWAHKIFIGLVALAFALAGWTYATYKPGKPDTYTAKAVLEVGSYVTSIGQIVTFEPAGDLVQVINKTTGVKASLLRGSNSLVELGATALVPKDANELLVQVVDFVMKRHEAVVGLIGKERLIRPTALIGSIQIQQQSLSEKRAEISILSVILGLILASMAILFRKFQVRRNKCGKARIEKGS